MIVAAFQNRTGDTTFRTLGAVAADWVSRGLAETRAVEVADPLLASMDSIEDPRIAGRRAQAGVVVLGEYTRQGDSLEIDARLVDPNTGRVLRATPAVLAPVAAPITAVDAIRQRITGAMAAEVDPLIAGLAREASQPPTYDAYPAWIEGLDRFSHKDYRGSVAPLLRAASLDSSFVTPRIWAAAAYADVGDYAPSDSLLAQVGRVRERLAPYDRDLLDHRLATNRGDLQAAYVAARELLAAAPASEVAIFLAGNAALDANRANQAVEVLRRISPERSAVACDVYGTGLAPALHAAGRHREELAETARRLAHAPASMRAMEEHARALIAVGRTAEATALAVRILETGRDSTRSPGYSANTLGDELVVHGHAADAGAVYRRVVQWVRASPSSAANSRFAREPLEMVLYSSGDLASADSVASAALLVDSTSVNALQVYGLVAARLGRVAEADRTSAGLAALTTPYLLGTNTLARATIAAQLDRKDEATRLARQANAEGVKPATLHLVPQFVALRGYPPFDALMRPADR